jgi:cyclase
MSSSHPHLDTDAGPPRVVEVADRVFAYVQPDGSWWINNTGFIVGEKLVVSIDTCSTEARTRAYLDAVEERAGDTPRVLVNTHHHGDHTNGNCLLPFATIIGHERCRQLILDSGILRIDGVWEPVEWGDLTAAPPFVTFEERPGSRSIGSSSAATSCSTVARRSCSWDRSAARSLCSTACQSSMRR